MKNKILVVALIAAVLMAGLVLVGCGNKCPGGGNAVIGQCSYSPNTDAFNIKECEDRCIRNQINADLTVWKDSYSCDCSS